MAAFFSRNISRNGWSRAGLPWPHSAADNNAREERCGRRAPAVRCSKGTLGELFDL
jgi:hypothetical protein